ncbi:NAD binding domain of 6-phosphogluconate dehydrogenase-domain-containing protein [Paraphoma chrysanthemicola]|uniref:NAD binding domain of 6-phosphogluconate dehydrogenase-domain-containing protein n=1 Tax=Paraphoma chrysanthemicola TaxID=798071 RepID=A0A8K0R042_9PLEO|nr:NAD binding domain of 6-phosphogluconate dehydrogenase-domain-containing protein [Paraphoma chrysanthemicola]
MSTKPSIGFCGLGAMGMGMATHLVKQGYPVTGFDVYPPSQEKFAAAGGTTSNSLSASAKDQAFYIVMVASAPQAHPALFSGQGIVQALPQGATLILCSTVASSYVKSVESKLAQVGRGDIFFIDAPVSGGAGRAADGTLSIMAGASDAAFKKGKWLLQEMSAPSKLFIVNGGIGAGSNMKMVHQVLAAIQILALSEAYGFAARLGLNGKDVCDAVLKSQGWSWMFENRSQRTLKEDYFPGASAVTIILKDTGIITYMSRSVNFPATLCSIAEQVYFSALDRGWGANDDAGLVRLWTSEPVSNITSTLSDSEKEAALKLVIDLLTGIHLVSAAEAISLANHVGIPLPQLYELACDAAGGSTMFKQAGAKMIDILEGRDAGEGQVLGGYAEALKIVVDKAQEIKCPVYLGSAALNALLATGPGLSLKGLLDGYTVK